MSEKTSFFKIGAGACFPVAVCRHGDIRQPRESRPLFALGRLEQIDFAALDLAVHVGQLGDYRRDEFERVGDGRLFEIDLAMSATILALKPLLHRVMFYQL